MSETKAEAAEGGLSTNPNDAEGGPIASRDRGDATTVPIDGVSRSEERSRVRASADYQTAIAVVCDELKDFLIGKNVAYGNSAFEPINIFSELDAREGILIRIDDKLKRLRNRSGYPGDNDVKDLTGYLILLQVWELMNA